MHSVLEVQDAVEQKSKQKCTRDVSLAHGRKKQLKVERENKRIENFTMVQGEDQVQLPTAYDCTKCEWSQRNTYL